MILRAGDHGLENKVGIHGADSSPNGLPVTNVINIKPGMKNLNLRVTLIDKSGLCRSCRASSNIASFLPEERRVSHGVLILLLVGDESASVVMTFYDPVLASKMNCGTWQFIGGSESLLSSDYYSEGDYLLISGCEARLWKHSLQISLQRLGKIKRIGE